MDENVSLWALFVSSFLAATILPGGSEVVLFGVLKLHPQTQWPAILVATAGNTLGGMSSYLIGRVLPLSTQQQTQRAMAWTRAYGSPLLLLSWVPLIGDPLCLAAGWLRLNPWLCFAFMLLGKLARYAVVASLAT